MPYTGKINFEDIIFTLLQERDEFTLKDIASKAGLSSITSAQRRAIQRVLVKLVEQQVLQPQGKARARRYQKCNHSEVIATRTLISNQHFIDIPLTKKATHLLQDISQPITKRLPVGYQREFLESYEPNVTAYLSKTMQEELLSLGEVEMVIRPAGTYARHILNRLLIDLSWNSSRLEGNTYSLLETKRLIELGDVAEDKNITETQMILNHKEAIEYMIELASENTISSHEIRSIHALLSENLLGDPSACGRLRQIAVGISGTTYLPLDNPHLLSEYFNIFIKKLNAIKNPFEQSFFSLVHLSYLQAFEDVNKRTARLVANIPMLQKNLKPLSFIDVSQQDLVLALVGVYEKMDVSLLRDLYTWAYKRSAQKYTAHQQSMGEPDRIKLKYREFIIDVIRTIILTKIASTKIVNFLKERIYTLHLVKQDEKHLFQLLETEIMSLHDGNIARYRIRPSEFILWKKRFAVVPRIATKQRLK